MAAAEANPISVYLEDLTDTGENLALGSLQAHRNKQPFPHEQLKEILNELLYTFSGNTPFLDDLPKHSIA